jgi:hypothetical protein
MTVVALPTLELAETLPTEPDSAPTKRCPRCTLHLTLDQWSVGSAYCKSCKCEYEKERKVRASKDSDSDPTSETDEWSVLRRARALELDLLDVLIRLRQWQGTCDACGIVESELSRSICLDHDHGTGTFRGFLCHMCNLTLGHAHDDIERLRSLITYLDRTNATADAVSTNV